MKDNIPLTMALIIFGTGILIWFGSNVIESWREWKEKHRR